MADTYIPAATLEKLATQFPKGTRHQAALDIAVPLIGEGTAPSIVFATLRSKFEADVSDKELHDVVAWASRQGIPPSTLSGNGKGHAPRQFYNRPQAIKPTRTPVEQCDWWTSGARLTPEDMHGLSPIPVPHDPVEQTVLALSSLYKPKENVNVVCKFTQAEDGKCNPYGAGQTLTVEAWGPWLRSKGVPASKAGAWMRLNPCADKGSGKEGAYGDVDITAFRYALIESDVTPVPMQLALYARLPMPCVAVLLSAGGSAHAWVKVEAQDQESYTETVVKLMALLQPFGFDRANKNPSRLTRLPGARREHGATGDGLQKLLWLNPNAAPLTAEGLKQLEDCLQFPAIEEKPLLRIASEALTRYEEMRQNVGKIGVPIGIPQFDVELGGLKKGQTIVVAGTTGGGKSTFGLHIVKSALKRGFGVLLFSLEMDREEIFDLLVCEAAEVDRNKFNSGRFSQRDFDAIPKVVSDLSTLALFIEDSPTFSAEQIRLRTLQLKAAGKVDLVVVDYIQFVNPGLTRDSREQQVAAISHALRALAREVKLPMVVLSQLNDEGKLRESRVISHNANIVLVVEQCKDTFKAKITKGRSVPEGEYVLEFQRRYARLVPPAYTVEEEEFPRWQTHPDP